MGVLESPGKVLDFFLSKRVGTLKNTDTDAVSMASMMCCVWQVMLPDTLPAQFQAIYTPIAAAGTQLQIKHLARLLATQLVAAGLGKGDQQQEQKKVVILIMLSVCLLHSFRALTLLIGQYEEHLACEINLVPAISKGSS